jgi:hypothetical protein
MPDVDLDRDRLEESLNSHERETYQVFRDGYKDRLEGFENAEQKARTAALLFIKMERAPIESWASTVRG